TKDKVNIIVATIAFGMGIDKPDVRMVIHFTYPKTLEGYYQEIGRAGRDGLPSECVMFYTYADTRKHEFFINKIDDPQLKSLSQQKLNLVSQYAKLTTCRKKYLLRYFGEDFTQPNCGSCDVCVPQKALVIAPTSRAPKIRGKKTAVSGYNEELFEQLRKLRRSLADQANVPAFIIFGDKALQEMAQYQPQNLASFSRISGVGAKKLEQFGALFLQTINQFLREQR
ncbi:ATP-dependent DNA helicase RecQ, partial [Candidatus Gracilibacteria bacterium]|nr:ATP-dependent DNA helicase RecQ [Candidatus Gracilibacteria bacterium]